MKFFRSDTPTPTDALIDAVREKMHKTAVDSDEYKQLLTTLERLHKIKTDEPRRDRVSRDAVVAVAGNLLMTLVVVAYEQHHVITSKAFGFIRQNNIS